MKVHSLFITHKLQHTSDSLRVAHAVFDINCYMYTVLCCVCTSDFATVYAEFIKTLILMEATLAAENEVRVLTHILYILLHVGEHQVNTEQVHKIMYVHVLGPELFSSKMLKCGN